MYLEDDLELTIKFKLFSHATSMPFPPQCWVSAPLSVFSFCLLCNKCIGKRIQANACIDKSHTSKYVSHCLTFSSLVYLILVIGEYSDLYLPCWFCSITIDPGLGIENFPCSRESIVSLLCPSSTNKKKGVVYAALKIFQVAYKNVSKGLEL